MLMNIVVAHKIMGTRLVIIYTYIYIYIYVVVFKVRLVLFYSIIPFYHLCWGMQEGCF